MTKLFLYNAYLPQAISTKYYDFEPIENFEELYNKWEKRNKVSRNENLRTTEVFENLKSRQTPKSVFYPTQPKIWDYCAVLSLFQARNIFPYNDVPGGSPLFARLGRSYDWPLLTSEEISNCLEQTVRKLTSLSNREQYVVLKSMMLLFEGEFFTHYRDFKDVWYLQPLELFCRGIYCLDHNFTDPSKAVDSQGNRIAFETYLKYCVDKFDYDRDYANKNQIDPFLKEIVIVRDWVMHGKVWNCGVFGTPAEEFTFYHRIEALLKTFLLSYLDVNSFTNRGALIHGIAYGNAVNPLWVKH